MDEYEKAKFDFYLASFRGSDSFVAQLFRLFQKADEKNKQRLGCGFPVHYQVFTDWCEAESEREFFAEYLKQEVA